ncbi:MAG: hypothetical protein DRP87_15425, partial [Spirochaetes bacterium]
MNIIEVLANLRDEKREEVIKIFPRIIKSYSQSKGNVCRREKSTPPSFYGIDNSWIWYSDFRDTFYIN